ncbi:MAG: restriction endonuclease subunit S [Kiritimatiellia bacterium]
MSENITTLGRIAKIYSGFAFKSKDLGSVGLPVVKIANIQDKRVLSKCKDHFPEELFEAKLQRYVLDESDILVAMTGAGSVGKIGKMPCVNGRYLVNQRVGIVRPDKHIADPKFVYYAISQDHYEKELYALGLGAGQPNVSAQQIGSLKISLPNLPTQKRIAGILSAYDDLIENNLKRIRILEEMAQSLYREWFVHFRYPGHESDPLVDSALGPIPEGWEVKTVGEKFQTILGGTPSRKIDSFWMGGTVPWINSGKVNELRIISPTSYITEEALKKSAAKLMPVRTTLLAITGATLGQVSLLEIECSANQSVVGITDKDRKHSEWLYLFFCDQIESIIKHASGGAQQHINKDIVNSVKFRLPHHAIMKRFQKAVVPIFDEIQNLIVRNQTLRQTRDLLLPKLLTPKA